MVKLLEDFSTYDSFAPASLPDVVFSAVAMLFHDFRASRRNAPCNQTDILLVNC